MISGVQGLPGSGKSWYLVWYMEHKKARYDYVITNVKGYMNGDNVRNVHGDKIIENIDSDWSKGKEILYVIDEAETYLKFLGEDKLEYIREHRHYGHDIVIAAQSLDEINRNVYKKLDHILSAQRASLKIFPWFLVYQKLAGGLKERTIIKYKDKKIFKLYKSQLDGKRIQNNWNKLLLVAGFFATVVALMALYRMATATERSETLNSTIEEKDKKIKSVNDVNELLKEYETVKLNTVRMEYAGRVNYYIVNGSNLIPIDIYRENKSILIRKSIGGNVEFWERKEVKKENSGLL